MTIHNVKNNEIIVVHTTDPALNKVDISSKSAVIQTLLVRFVWIVDYFTVIN